jgi:hypothetical protein
MHKPPKRIEMGSLVSEACLGAIRKTCPNVADDSSLRQAKDVETKRNAGSSRSVPKPDAETSHAPTTQDNSGTFYSRYAFVQGKKRGVSLGSCG